MNYKCDMCGCYLDPGEGGRCDECRAISSRTIQAAKRISDAIRLKENQYEMNMEGMLNEYYL